MRGEHIRRIGSPIHAADSAARALREAGVTPAKKRGQNFLVQGAIADKIVALADLRAGDEVVEIGPGLGILSERIMQTPVSMLHLIEVDRGLAARLDQRLAGAIDLVNADLLKLDLRRMITRPPVKVLGNLPFNVAAAMLRKLGDIRDLISRMVLMFQREVGERLRAGAGEPAYGALSALTALDWEITRHFRVEAGSFHPRPRVDAEVLCFVPAPASRCPPELRPKVTETIRAGFALRRKNLRNALSAGLRISPETVQAALESVNIEPTDRAERLGLVDFMRIAAALPATISRPGARDA